MEILKSLIGPIAKAVAGALVPVVLFLIGWFVEKTGIPIDVDPQEVNQWVLLAITSLSTGLVVWWTTNHPKVPVES